MLKKYVCCIVSASLLSLQFTSCTWWTKPESTDSAPGDEYIQEESAKKIQGSVREYLRKKRAREKELRESAEECVIS